MPDRVPSAPFYHVFQHYVQIILSWEGSSVPYGFFMLLNPSSEYKVLVTVFSRAVCDVYKWMLISYTSKIIYCLPV